MGPAPVIIASLADVGAKLIASAPVVPLRMTASLSAVGSPPFIVMPVKPVGVFGLFKLIVSVPAPASMVKLFLLIKSINSKLSTVTRAQVAPNSGLG